jgi:replicative DNA helicase
MVKLVSKVDTYIENPPYCRTSEQAVLGALLIDNRAYDRVSDIVSESDFFIGAHREIWKSIRNMIEAGKPADLITVASELPEQAGYIGELFTSTPSAINAPTYAQTVRDRSVLRQLMIASADISAAAQAQGADPMEAADFAEQSVLKVMQRDAEASEAVDYRRAVFEARDWLDEPQKGISTGIPMLDRMTLGLQPGQLWIVGGRPSMGKSALGVQIAEHVAQSESVALFSLEMSRRQVAARSIRWHEQRLGSRDEAVNHLSYLHLVIDDGGKLTPGVMRLKLRRIKRKSGLAVVVIDYMQLMSTARPENRLQEVSEVSRSLKQIAKEFNCCVIAVCQLNRAAESRTDKRPMLSDLRESGQLEQDADVVVMVHREAYYAPQTPIGNVAELLVRKCRDGETGTAWCLWNGELTRFTPTQAPEMPTEQPRERARTVTVP